MTTLLSTQQLTLGYRRQTLFEDVNLSLIAGELVSLMGPNGIGKSTLIRTLAGLQTPMSGDVKISAGKQTRLAEQIAVVLTDRVSAPTVTVHELIALGRYPYLAWHTTLREADLAAIDNAVDQTHIKQLLEKKVSELSDGQIQLVMIARALAQDTPIILLDEPTAHLDLNNRLDIMKLLRCLAHTQKKGIVVSTHDLDLALQTSDRIWLTTLDKKIIEGIPEDLVLTGVFDEIFQFKGFDLKSGKVQHDSFLQKKVNVIGEGHELLWTKNALERCGIEVDQHADKSIIIEQTSSAYRWHLGTNTFSSLADLLDFIRTI
jgi:iron complex transport system ATP-binding protein